MKLSLPNEVGYVHPLFPELEVNQAKVWEYTFRDWDFILDKAPVDAPPVPGQLCLFTPYEQGASVSADLPGVCSKTKN